MNKGSDAYKNRGVKERLCNDDYEDPECTETAKQADSIRGEGYEWSQHQSDLIENFDDGNSFKPLQFN